MCVVVQFLHPRMVKFYGYRLRLLGLPSSRFFKVLTVVRGAATADASRADHTGDQNGCSSFKFFDGLLGNARMNRPVSAPPGARSRR